MFSLFRKRGALCVRVPERDLEFQIRSGATLLESMLADGVAMPHDCKVGTCGTCRYRLEEGKISELSPSAMALNREELTAGYRLACQTLAKTDLRIAIDKLGEEAVRFEHFSAKVVGAPLLSHDIIGLELGLDRPIAFTAGQYADLAVAGVDGARSYSFAFAPTGEPRRSVRFHIRKVPGGAFTEWLFAADRVGERLDLSGPGGFFRLHGAQEPILCIAGGSGLAPIIAILEEARWAGVSRPVRLLYGARAQRDLYCEEAIARLASDWPERFDYLAVLSAEPEASDWPGARGLVTEQIAVIPELASHHCYLCGPPPMIDAAEAVLLGAGIAPQAIIADRFYDRSRPAPPAL